MARKKVHHEPRECPVCGEMFTPLKATREYCYPDENKNCGIIASNYAHRSKDIIQLISSIQKIKAVLRRTHVKKACRTCSRPFDDNSDSRRTLCTNCLVEKTRKQALLDQSYFGNNI